jgi:hypothetical protein
MLSRINPLSIISRHFSTLYDSRTGSISSLEIAVILLVAVACGIVAGAAAPNLVQKVAGGLLNFYAIVGGFLISALFMIVTYGDTIWSNRKDLPKGELDQAKTLQREIFSNVCFGVLVAFAGSALCIFLPVEATERYVSGGVAFLLVIFVHTILMVLKRLEALFRRVT